MGQITKIIYEELPEEVCSVETLGDANFFINLLEIDGMSKEYEKFELKMNQIKKDLVSNMNIKNESRIPTLLISSRKNKIILVI